MSKPTLNISEALDAVVAKIEDDYSNNSCVTGLATGFTELDQMTAGLHPGDLIVVAGRPSFGKTAFSTNIAENVALQSKLPVSLFNMEMDTRRLALRMLSSSGRLNQFHLLNGQISDDEWKKLTRGLGDLNDAPIEIINTLDVGWTANAISQLLLTREKSPALLVVDGLHSFDVTNVSSAYDRNILLGEQARILKRLALTLNIPIILTCTLGRELESRPNKRPILKDLRDVGALEDIADIVLFIYRDEVYNPDSKDKGSAEIIIGKQRNGPLGKLNLAFYSECSRFDN